MSISFIEQTNHAGRLEQLKELWHKFFDLDEEVQQAALPTRSEYSSQLVAVKDLLFSASVLDCTSIWVDLVVASGPLTGRLGCNVSSMPLVGLFH